MEGILEGERKEEDFIIKIVLGSRIFSFRCGENARFFGTFRGLEGILEGERKEEDLKQEYTDKSMVAAGFTFLFICMGNAEIFAILWEWEGK